VDSIRKSLIYVFWFWDPRHTQRVMIAFLLTAFFVGFVIVYIVPKVNGWLTQIPQASSIVNNKFAQLLIVGVVVILGLHVFIAVVGKKV